MTAEKSDEEDDSGTWEMVLYYGQLSQKFTSTKHEGTFLVVLDDAAYCVYLVSDTIVARGTGIDLCTPVYTITDGYYNGSALPEGSTETLYLGTDGNIRMVGTGHGFSATGTYKIDVTLNRITVTFTNGDVTGTMTGTYENTGKYITVSSGSDLKVKGVTATLSGKAERQ